MRGGRSSTRGRAIHSWPQRFLLAIYQELYDIEDRGKTLSCAEREALRSTRKHGPGGGEFSGELLDGEAASRVLSKDKFAEAFGYLRNHWNALQVYLGDKACNRSTTTRPNS